MITRLNVGGPARHALLLTKGLSATYRTTLVAGSPAPAEGELSDPAVAVRHLPLVRPLQPGADARALAAAHQLITRSRPALVHTHMAKAGTVGRLAALRARYAPRTVHTFHGHVLDGYFRPSTQRAFIEAERWLASRTDVLVAVSAEVRDALLDLRVGRPAQYRVVPVGLELAPFLAVQQPAGLLRASLGVPFGAPLIGVVGRLVPIKDHLTLLAAMELLPDVHLAVIGDGELRKVLEARARESGIAKRVHFTGWSTDVASALSDLDVVVLTSRNEGTPVALIEAAATARPVVATDVGGVRSVVSDGHTGFLAPPGDARKVAALVARLLEDPDLRRRMGDAGRARVADRFGETRLLSDIGELYADLLVPAAARRPLE